MKAWVFLCMTMLLTACASTVISYTSYDPNYRPGEHLYAGSDLDVQVIGSPFGLPNPQFADAVVDAMQGPVFGGPTHFTRASSEPRSPYRIYMVFDPLPGIGDTAICSNPNRPLSSDQVAGSRVSTASPRTIGLVAVLCRADRVMSSATGYLADVTGPDDPAFRSGIGQFTLALFPARNPNDDRDHGSIFDFP